MVEKVWLGNVAVFVYVSTNYVEIVKYLKCSRYVQLTRGREVTLYTKKKKKSTLCE